MTNPMNNPVAPVVTDEMVEAAWKIYTAAPIENGRKNAMRAAITAALEASGELERLRAALHKAEIEREYWRGFAVQTKQQVEGFVKKLQDWTNEGELIQGGYNAGT